MRTVEAFFQEIDSRWKRRGADPVVLRVIGCSALLLQTDYARGTKDSDIFETEALTPR